MTAVFLKSGQANVKISFQHRLHEASHICSTPATPLQLQPEILYDTSLAKALYSAGAAICLRCE